MADNELKVTVEAGIVNLLPSGRVAVELRRGWGQRAGDILSSIVAAVGEEALEARVAESEELEALLGRAVTIGATSTLREKRALLAKVVAQASEDDAWIDGASLILDALSRIDAPHVRCLARIEQAEKEARRTGEMEEVAHGAEKPLTDSVRNAVSGMPEPVISRLIAENLIVGSVSWDGIVRVTGMTTFGERILADLRSVS